MTLFVVTCGVCGREFGPLFDGEMVSITYDAARRCVWHEIRPKPVEGEQ